MKPLTQADEIILHLHRNKSITRAEAANLHIYELSSRIGELEKKGWQFDREPVSGKNKHGRTWRVIRYSNPRKVA